MVENKYIFPDDELMELSELAPLTQSGTLDDLLAEAKEVMRAIDEAEADDSVLVDDRAWALYLMRGFYFLGMLRGSEVYRAALLIDNDMDDDVPKSVSFALSKLLTDLFVRDIQGEPTETLTDIYKVLGLMDTVDEGK